MKKFIIAVSPIFFLILFAGSLLVPDPGHAQVFNNEIGLYTDLSADPASTSIIVESNVLFDVYLIVTNPVNDEFGPPDCLPPIQRDIPIIDIVQFRMLVPEVGLYTMAATPNGILSGWAGNPPDYGIVFEMPVPVPENRAALLFTFTFMTLDTDPKEFFLEPTVTLSEDRLAIWDASEILDPRCPNNGRSQNVFPVSGDYAMPVFGINTSVVTTEDKSFGSVKALYR
jgi:hypothetical protein